jgi:hypothetical protein
MGFRTTQLVYVAAKLGLADLLAQEARTATDLAAATKVEPCALYRLLRALASLGIFAESDGGLFGMTPTAELLRRDRPGSLRSTVMLYGDEFLWRAYGQLFRAVETGQSAFSLVYGQSFYDYLGEHPASAALFHEAMTGFSQQEEIAILSAYNFSRYRSIIDIGGGQGELVFALLRAHSNLKAAIFDRTPPSEESLQMFASCGFAARAQFLQWDFFTAIPKGHDVYLLKSVIHNWDDAAAITILGRCRDAMPAEARLLLAERVIPAGNAPSEAKLFDINMLVSVGGQERTEAQYAALFDKAGLELTRAIPTASHLCLVEAAPKKLTA